MVTGWIYTGETFTATREYTEQSVTLFQDESKWSCLGAQHDRADYYGRTPLARILSDVNVNLYLLLFPVTPKPMGPIDGDPHLLRAGKDYPCGRRASLKGMSPSTPSVSTGLSAVLNGAQMDQWCSA